MDDRDPPSPPVPEPPPREWQERLARWLGRLLWRRRRELAPLWLGAVPAASLAAVGHLWLPLAWPLPAPAGAALTAAAARWLAEGKREQRYAIVLGSVATLWTLAGWGLGLLHPLAMVLLIVALAACLPWVGHQAPRSKVDVSALAGGEKRSARQWAEELIADWDEAVAPSTAANLPGSRVVGVRYDGLRNCVIRLRLRRGTPRRRLQDPRYLAALESAMQVREGSLRVVEDPRDAGRANRVALLLTTTNPMTQARVWPRVEVADSITEPLSLGWYEHGATWRLPLLWNHLLIAGVMGSGKSGAIYAVMAELAVRRDVVLLAVDLKGGVELDAWRPRLLHMVDRPGDVGPVFRALLAAIEARMRILRSRSRPGQRLRKWTPSAAEPAIVLVVDEYGELETVDKKLLQRIMQLGRAAGVMVVACTQRPDAPTLGGEAGPKAQFTYRICLRVTTASDIEVILGPGASRIWRAHELEDIKGICLPWTPGARPEMARGWLVEDDQVDALMAGGPWPQLDAGTAQALAALPSQDADGAPLAAPRPAPTAAPVAPMVELAADELAAIRALAQAPTDGLTWVQLVAGLRYGKSKLFGLLADLQRRRLVESSGGRWRLTPDGAAVPLE